MNILKKKIAIIGLGYVGLPLILEFAKKFDVVGYDSNKKRIDELKNGIDNTNEINSKGLNNLKKINFSNKPEALKEKDIYIITVPTPIDKNKRPNLKFLKSA